MKKIDLLDQRSDFVKEVLETPPNKVISWGNTFFFVFIGILLLLCWLIKYPDIVSSEIVLTTKNPPVYLSPNLNGKIDAILKNDKEYAKKEDWLVVVGSNANLDHIEKLKSLLSTAGKTNYDLNKLKELEFPILDVGEIQSNYNALVKSVTQYQHHQEDGNFIEQAKLNNLQLQHFNSIISGAVSDRLIAEKELVLAKTDLERHRGLFEKGVLAQKEFESVELRYLQSERNLENVKSNILRIKAQRAALLGQGSSLRHGEEETQINSELDILETLKLTELSFIEWVKKHVLLSTVSGQVNFLDFFAEDQFIENGKTIISVIPEYNEDDYFGVLKMPIMNSGKVKKEQKVNIKLPGFPHEEYGLILGTITSISEVTNEDFYLVKVKLTEGLRTTFNKEINFKQNINGTAEIITDDLRLIERFVYTLTKALN